LHVLFVESICDDKAMLEENYKLKLHSPDYAHMPPDEARADFVQVSDGL
jgi:hypothetical protein